MRVARFLSLLAAGAWAISSGVMLAAPPHVGIEATAPVTAEPAPGIVVAPGEFTIRRDGDLSGSLWVFVAYSGTATPEADYAELPGQIEFAPGEASVKLQVLGVDDDKLEADETVVATLYDPTLGPIPRYEIDPAEATVVIRDSDGGSGGPVVRIDATRRIAEESSNPLDRLELVGEFTVSRSIPTDHSQPVWIHVSGSATPGKDYDAIPWLVSIPAGETSVSFPVTAIPDQEPEGIETVIATVSNCPPETDPPLGAPCYLFEIDPAHASDTVFIREDGLSVASVHITTPVRDKDFPVGDPIPIEAVAIHLESYINRVEFLADGTLIGVSELHFIQPPNPGTPIHHSFAWLDAAAGTHVLTGRANDPLGQSGPIVSSPVRISVSDVGPNQPPLVAIVSPASGDEFPAGDPIPITIEARDPDGYITHVRFFADGVQIGERAINHLVEPPPGELQTFTFDWEHAMPGDPVLTARVTDNRGASGDSEPVAIRVRAPDARPLVHVVARDAFAVEPAPDGTPDTATFRIRRHGATDGELRVLYTVDGRATNGVDYQPLSGWAVIPDGHAGVDVTVVPLADDETEGHESVIVRLAEDPAYLQTFPRRAIAVISDKPWPHPPDRLHCDKLRDGLVHLCFPAPTGGCFRLEGSHELRNWTTWFCLDAVDGVIHFVVDPSEGPPCLYFRTAPEPNGDSGGV